LLQCKELGHNERTCWNGDNVTEKDIATWRSDLLQPTQTPNPSMVHVSSLDLHSEPESAFERYKTYVENLFNGEYDDTAGDEEHGEDDSSDSDEDEDIETDTADEYHDVVVNAAFFSQLMESEF